MRSERGAVLVEFALVALALALLLSASAEFGRLMVMWNAVQVVARAAEAAIPAHDPMTPGSLQASVDMVYDPGLLVVDVTAMTQQEIDAFFSGAPLVNRALKALMYVETVPGDGTKLLRWPGALLADINSPSMLTVGVPQLTSRGLGAPDQITWKPVIEVDEALGQVRVNYPFQGLFTDFQSNPDGPYESNIENAVAADDSDDGVDQTNDVTAIGPGVSLLADSPTPVGPYAGPYGLGRQYAFATVVRPFQWILQGTAIPRTTGSSGP